MSELSAGPQHTARDFTQDTRATHVAGVAGVARTGSQEFTRSRYDLRYAFDGRQPTETTMLRMLRHSKRWRRDGLVIAREQSIATLTRQPVPRGRYAHGQIHCGRNVGASGDPMIIAAFLTACTSEVQIRFLKVAMHQSGGWNERYPLTG